MTVKQLRRGAFSLLLAMLMVAGSLTALADETAACTVRIEGISGNLYYEQAALPSAPSVLAVLETALKGANIPYEVKDGYISKIGEDAAGAFGGWDGWVYYVNGQEAAVSMAEYTLHDGDALLVCYGDPYGNPATLLPQAAAALSGDMVNFTFTAQISVFDDAGGMTRQTVPVQGATATIGGTQYITDERGVAAVPRRSLTRSSVSVQLEKTGEDGKPLVVRLAPDFTLELPFNTLEFSDISATAWYKEYVLELVALGAVEGYGDGTFRPTREVTRAEYIKILACTVAGFDPGAVAYQSHFTDVAKGDWYAPYIVWAADQGIITKGGAFNPGVNLTRQDMALIAYEFAVKVLGKTLPQSGGAPAFVDEADIDGSCREAIYFLQKAGVIEGVRNAEGFAFEPRANTVRSQVSKVIVKLINLD